MSESQTRDESGQFTGASDDSGDDTEQQYEHVVLIMADEFAGDEQQQRVLRVLKSACDEEDLDLAGHEFAEDRVHAFVETRGNVTGHEAAERLHMTTRRRYRYHPTYTEPLGFARGLSAGTVDTPEC